VLTRIELEESRSWAKREEIWSVKLERKKERKKEGDSQTSLSTRCLPFLPAACRGA